MKKVILFILSLVYLLKVNALTYYSEYNDSFDSESYFPISDTLIREEEEFYEVYEENTIYAYLLDSDNNYEETGNYITTYTGWTIDKNEVDFNYPVEKYYEYMYIPTKEYNSIAFKNISNHDVYVKRLRIYDPQHNRIMYEGELGIFKNNTLITFPISANLANMEIEMDIDDYDPSISVYALLDETNLSTLEFIETMNSSFVLDDFSKYGVLYPSIRVLTTENFQKEKKSHELYSTKYRNAFKYKEYKITTRSYLGIFSNDPDETLDYTRALTLYHYKTRDKVIINDEITSLDNVILYSTVDDVIVDCIDDKIYVKIPFLEDTIELEKSPYLKEIEYLNERLERTKKEETEMRNEAISLENQLLIYKERLSTNTKRIEELESINNTLIKDIQSIVEEKEESINKLKEEIIYYKNLIKENDKEKEYYNSLIEENNNVIEKLKEEKNTLIKQLEEIKILVQEKEEEKNILLKELDNTNYLVDKKNLEIKELIDYSDTYTENLVDDLNNCNEEKKLLKDKKIELEEEKEVKKGSLYYILVIVILSVVLTICRIMSSKKIN